MIIIQDTFVCKPGNASKLAKLCKETMGTFAETKAIMTDMTGQFNRVIVVSEYADLKAYQESWEKMANMSPEQKEAMKKMDNYTEMYQTGSREIFKVW
jgi:hypothetical protein